MSSSVVIDGLLRYFGALCDQISSDSRLAVKEEIIAGFIARYHGDLGLLFKLLLPKYNARLYHLQDKQLIKLFAIALNRTEKTLKDDVNVTGCIATTVSKLFVPRATAVVDPTTGWCALTLEDLDAHLEALSKVTQEEAQLVEIRKFLGVACKNAVFLYLRQIKQDLKLGANIRSILSGLHPSANDIFKQCANVQEVVRRVQAGDTTTSGDAAARTRSPSPGGVKKGMVAASITLGMPLSPMLAAPSKGVEHVLTKCPNGAFSETKYDGERIQIHKNDDCYSFFARSMKPMKEDKFEGLHPFLVKALKSVKSCILDGEILLMDIATSQPLPFGTLGKHKKAQFTTACTCIVLFDIMYLNGEPLLSTPLDERRSIIKAHVDFIPNRVVLSEMRHVSGTLEQRTHILKKHLGHAIAEGLEGLVIKDVKSLYEPAARHWVKLKKDYLEGMADSADLVVLGAYYGSGNKGGLLSTFLMGVCDKSVPVGGRGRWKTVCKVGNGHDDATIAALNVKYKATMQPPVNGKAPVWADVHNSHIPDVFVIDPEASDVWEIIGAEFSTTKTHTAASISFRFPRVLKRRDDKDPNTATSLAELVKLVEVSKEKATRVGLAGDLPNDDEEAPTASPTTAQPPPLKESLPAQEHTVTDALPSAARFSRAHEQDEDYLARFAPTLADDEEQRRAPAPPPETSASPSVVMTPSIPIEYVCSEIAQPLSSAAKPHQNIVILHSTAHKGKWSNRGTMGSITKILGEEPQEAYNELSPTIKMGEVIFCEVSNRQSSGKLFVGTMIGQNATSGRAGEVPQVNKEALAECIRKGFKFAIKYDASVHIAKLDRMTGVDWGAVDVLLKTLAKEGNVRVVVYSRDGGALARTKTYATVPPSIEAPVGFTHIKSPSTSLGATTPSTEPRGSGGATPPFAGSSSTSSQLRALSSSLPQSDTSTSPAASIPFTRTESDLGNTPFFLGCVCALSPAFGLRDAATIKQKLTMAGGRSVLLSQASEATHIIAASVDDATITSCCDSTTTVVPIVLRGWVDDSFVTGKLLPTDTYKVSPPPSQGAARATAATATAAASLPPQRGGSMVFLTLQGNRFVLEGFDASVKEREEIATKICMMGGVVQDRWKTTGSEKSNYLVAHALTPEAQRVHDLGGVVVMRTFVDEALATGVAPTSASRLAPHLWGDKTGCRHDGAPPSGHSEEAELGRRTGPAAATVVHFAPVEHGAMWTSPLPKALVTELPPTLREDSEQTPTKAIGDPHPAVLYEEHEPSVSLSVSRAQSPPQAIAATSVQRTRQSTPPRVDILAGLSITDIPRNMSGVLRGTSVCIEGFGLSATERLSAVISGLGASLLPRASISSSRVVLCDTLTALSKPLCSSGKVLTTAWLRAVIAAGMWIDPTTNPSQFICGNVLLSGVRAMSPVTRRREREELTDTEDDDMNEPPAKVQRQEKLEKASAHAPLSSLPPTQIPETLLADDQRTETASTITDDANSPHAGASPSLSSTDIDEEGKHCDKNNFGTDTLRVAELPPLLDGLLAVMVPIDQQDRDEDTMMSLNEARRYVIAFGGEVASSLAQLRAEWAQWGFRRSAGVALLQPSHPMALDRGAIDSVRKVLTDLSIPVLGSINKAWVLDSVQQGKKLPML